MSSSKALKKKISKRAKQKKNIQVKNSIRLKNAKLAESTAAVTAEATTETAVDAAANIVGSPAEASN
jgi:Tfp pilus assembly protein FimV